MFRRLLRVRRGPASPRGSPWPVVVVALLLAPVLAVAFAPPAAAATFETSRTVVIRAAAVSETEDGLVGSTATISITSAANGSGHVFLDTFPLTQVDMQGSARLAARVAAQIAGKDVNAHDFFFVVRSNSRQIGGPSAGASMTVGAVAALNDWELREDALMTGTINADGTVGPVGGIAEKATAAAGIGITRFLFPAGQEVVPFGDRVVNMTAYCEQELSIECLPVADVVEAIGLMTDHVIERPPISGNVTGEEYLARLAPLGGELVADAQALLEEARVAYEALPEGAARTGLADRFASAQRLVDKAGREVVNGTFYTAASTSFQASIDAEYVRMAAGVVAADDITLATQAALDEAATVVRDARGQVESSPVRDTNSFEAYGAAQLRLLEAESRLAQARTMASSARTAEQLFQAVAQAAYALARADTAVWWLQLAEGFPEGRAVEADALEETARDTLTTATEEVAYVEAVFLSAGGVGASSKSADMLSDARDLLRRAEEGVSRGLYAGAMLNALDASVRASVALEIAGFGGTVPDSKLQTAREYAARAIQGARARGVESIVAQSAYEFGLSLPDPADTLAFLGFARVAGNLAGLPGIFDEARPPASRFQGNPAPFRVEAVYVAAAFATGIALGVGSGLAAMMPRKPEDDEPVGASAPDGSVLGSDVANTPRSQ